MVSHWRNQCGAETREALLTNAANVSAERDTNQVLSDSLLAAEDERDQLKAENEALRKIATGKEIVWCACGDGYPANSYGAGFMDANEGVCQNCDAAK